MFSPCMNEQGFHVQESSCLENRFPSAHLSCAVDAVVCEAVNILLCMPVLFFICLLIQHKPKARWGSPPDAELP